jgi:glycosyltransferase involved in cell wall biosynthesis
VCSSDLGFDACALYRLFIPHLHTPNSRFVFNFKQIPIEEYADVNVLVVQRQGHAKNKLALEELNKFGLKIIYDLDDDLWNLSAANPARNIFRDMRDGFGECAALCELVTVSTSWLKSAVRTALPSLKKEIYVVENSMDFDYFQGPQLPRDESRVVIGWGGSDTHSADVSEVFRMLPDILDEFPQVHMEFVGQMPPKKMLGHERVRIREFVPVSEYPSKYSTWAWDIILAPLENTRFNRAKSNIKMLESAAIGAPCLCSPIAAYAEFCSYDSDLKYLTCTTWASWKTKIRELIADAAMRKALAQKMRKVVEDHYHISTMKAKWHEVFDSI